MFQESKTSELIWNYFNEKYGQVIAPIGLLKTCSILSCKFPTYPRLSILNVAPTRQLKSQTTNEMKAIFPSNFYIPIGSDFTIHGLKRKYSRILDRKCLLINDGTLLLSSKGKNTKDRLVNALAELMSDGRYLYADNITDWTLEGRISVIMNMTTESYSRYKNSLLGSTFIERFITVFYHMPVVEQTHYIEHMDKRVKIVFGQKLKKIVLSDLKNKEEYTKVLIEESKVMSALSLKNIIGVYDQLYALIKAHANLNNRDYICHDDLDFFHAIKPYMIDETAPNEHRIVELHKQGRSQKDICLIMGKNDKNYQGYVSKVITKARQRGVVD